MKILCERGFTFVEIAILAVIIVLLAVIAIPNFMKSKWHANEENAIASLRLIHTAMESFRAGQRPKLYTNANSLSVLSTSKPPYIDTMLGNGTKQGYNFRLNDVSAYGYTAQARPVAFKVTGNRSFVIDETGVLRVRGQSDWLAKAQGEIVK
ncbi:MAG: type II secretion system protein [Candidatus Omnitrophota bacterium]|jgi:Tfp pilus assembly protein PilE